MVTMPKHLKKITEEIIHENPWWIYKHDTYLLPDQKTGDYFYGESNGSVMIIPILEDGTIAMTLQYRYIHQRSGIAFPGGGIPKGMSPLQAAKHELHSETGCIASHFTNIGVFEPSVGLVKDMTHVFIAQVEKQLEPQPDQTEAIETIYRKPDDIKEMIKQNDIWCGQTLASWALAQNYFLTESPKEESPGFRTIFNYFLDPQTD